MRELIQQWINEKDLPELLRTIAALCHERYERDSTALYQRYKDNGRAFFDEDPPEIRKAHDIGTAFLCIDTTYLASDFEKRISQAGLSNAELDALRRKEEIERLEAELERKRSIR
jgi:uncharacterized small protein (DUF1192 family)